MYRTSHQTRILSAALAAVFGFGLVATAGGALRDDRSPTNAVPLTRVQMEPIVIRLHQPARVATACDQPAKSAL
ncbi:MAG: hypothetical protein M3Q28_11555 [Pseudomonadota bacterium]|nr:hypothetical protein [Pseudomonadota bacterium]